MCLAALVSYFWFLFLEFTLWGLSASGVGSLPCFFLNFRLFSKVVFLNFCRQNKFCLNFVTSSTQKIIRFWAFATSAHSTLLLFFYFHYWLNSFSNNNTNVWFFSRIIIRTYGYVTFFMAIVFTLIFYPVAYLISRLRIAALIGGRRLKEGSTYFKLWGIIPMKFQNIVIFYF